MLNPFKQLDAANSARDRSEWGKAAKLYRRYLMLRDDEPDIWVQLGNMYKESGQYTKSRSAYERAIALGLDTSDVHLQLGHLGKVAGDRAAAAQSYLRALDFLPLNLDAFGELERLGFEREANEIAARRTVAELRDEHLIVFDVSDLVFYIGHHDNLSGIQRVQCCVIQALAKYELLDARDVRYIAYDRSVRSFRSICPDRFLALLDDLSRPREQRMVEFDAAAARHGRLYPEEPLAAFIRPGRTTIALLGAAWVIPEYPSLIANLKRRHDAAFAALFHDFIPIYARDTCDQGTAEVFKEFVDQVLPITDLAMCVSRSTEADLKRYCRESGYEAPPTLVTRLGSSFDEFFALTPSGPASLAETAEAPDDTPYVLFVSTIEGRKNHNYLFEIWQRLQQRGVALPRVICVGRIGWRAESFLRNLLETDYLGGLFELREDVSDEALDALYRGCLFTVFPSVYEGWGLPIGESLGHGKLCVLTNNSSLPEVAGEFGCTIPLDDVGKAADIIGDLLIHPEKIGEYETAIAERYKPLRWRDVAGLVARGCLAARRTSLTRERPRLQLGTEYTVKRLKGSFDGILGRAMLEAMEENFSAPITGGHARSIHRVEGLLARDGNWFPPENWGCWALRDRAGIEVSLDTDGLADDEPMFLCGAFSFLPSMIGTRLQLSVGGQVMGQAHPVLRQDMVLSWPLAIGSLRRSTVAATSKTVELDLQFELLGVSSAALEASRAIDPRTLTFGLRSFVLQRGETHADNVAADEGRGYEVVH